MLRVGEEQRRRRKWVTRARSLLGEEEREGQCEKSPGRMDQHVLLGNSSLSMAGLGH